MPILALPSMRPQKKVKAAVPFSRGVQFGSWTTAHSRPWDELHFLVLFVFELNFSLFFVLCCFFGVVRGGGWGGMNTSLLRVCLTFVFFLFLWSV